MLLSSLLSGINGKQNNSGGSETPWENPEYEYVRPVMMDVNSLHIVDKHVIGASMPFLSNSEF